MQIQNIIIDSYKTQMDVEIPIGGFCEKLSEEYNIEKLVKFQIKLVIIPTNPFSNDPNKQTPTTSSPFSFPGVQTTFANESRIQVFVKFVNELKNTSIYVQFSSKALNIQDMYLKADSKWHMVIEKCVRISKFDIYFTLDVENNKFKVLYDDEELMDFELRGDDGSVKVHKCMLAATSPVFKTMIQGDSKETRDGSICLEGMSKSTLQEFKQYIYLNSLPSPVSQQILIIAMCYQIPDMEIACIKNLMQVLKVDNICELLDFAVTHKSDRLKIAILDHVQKGLIKVDQLKKRLEEKDKETVQNNVTKSTT